MIECIFTLDYEIYGNGEGSLQELVYEPTERLKTVFEKSNARFVVFAEAAELEIIEANNSDQAINLVKKQIRELYGKGYELGLHLHPQWYNARYENNKWQLDYTEYNLCTLPRNRIEKIVERSVGYLRRVLGVQDFSPFSFRAGNWLFQPTQPTAEVLAQHNIRVDSSVFPGGMQHQYRLDYRRAIKNGYYWPFLTDVNIIDRQGILMEFPIYTRMVPFWTIFTSKRIGLQQKIPKRNRAVNEKILRLFDFMRLFQSQKLDFCRMTKRELIKILAEEIQRDQKDPDSFRPIIAIGHTKDLVDLETVDSFLCYLRGKNIPIMTFAEISRERHLHNHQIAP